MSYLPYVYSSGKRMAMNFALMMLLLVLALAYLLLGFATLHYAEVIDASVKSQMAPTVLSAVLAKAGYLLTLLWIWRAPYTCIAIIALLSRGMSHISRRAELGGAPLSP
jgi:hypothetical protein